MVRNFKITLILLLAALSTYAVYAENITVSTFYPSPFGSYNDLRTATFTATGATSLQATTMASATVTGDSTINGSETILTNLVVDTNTLVVRANQNAVGIGMTPPVGTPNKLLVNGTIALNYGNSGTLQVNCPDGVNCYATSVYS